MGLLITVVGAQPSLAEARCITGVGLTKGSREDTKKGTMKEGTRMNMLVHTTARMVLRGFSHPAAPLRLKTTKLHAYSVTSLMFGNNSLSTKTATTLLLPILTCHALWSALNQVIKQVVTRGRSELAGSWFGAHLVTRTRQQITWQAHKHTANPRVQ